MIYLYDPADYDERRLCSFGLGIIAGLTAALSTVGAEAGIGGALAGTAAATAPAAVAAAPALAAATGADLGFDLAVTAPAVATGATLGDVAAAAAPIAAAGAVPAAIAAGPVAAAPAAAGPIASAPAAVAQPATATSAAPGSALATAPSLFGGTSPISSPPVAGGAVSAAPAVSGAPTMGPLASVTPAQAGGGASAGALAAPGDVAGGAAGTIGAGSPVGPVGGATPSIGSLNPSMWGGGGEAEFNAAAAGPSSPIGSALSGAKDWLSSNQGWLSPAIAGLGLGYDLLKGNETPQYEPQVGGAARNITAAAQGLEQQGGQLQSYLTSGNLPPGVNASLDVATNSAIASIKSQYASLGMSGSSAEAEDINNVMLEKQAQGSQIALSLYQQGTSEITSALGAFGEEANIYSQLMDVGIQQNAELGQAISSFAAALAPRSSITINQPQSS